MTGIVKTDQIQGAGSSTVTIPSGTALNVTTVSGTPAFSGDVTLPSINGGQIGGRRNMVINGAMQVAQRGTSQASISSAGYYTIDRFKINTNDAGVWTMSQEALSSSDTPFTEGFTKALKLDCTTSATPASNGTLQVQYSTEGQDLQQLASGTSSAKTLILSFWIKATKTGTNVLGGYQDDGGKSFGLTYTINSSNTWEYKTITIPANTADVIANDGTRGRIVTWYFSAGTNRTTGTLRSTWTTYATADEAPGQVNHADNTANNIHITGVQLEVGSQATAFEHRSFGEELALCQRYFFQLNGIGNEYATMGAGAMYQAAMYLGAFQLPVAMRTRPSFSLNNSLSSTNFSVVTAGQVKAISGVTPTGDNQHLRINAAITSNGTVGDGAYIQLQSGYSVLWDSEL